MIDIFLISDFQLLSDGLALLLRLRPQHFRLSGTASSLDPQVLPWQGAPPDVVVLDAQIDRARLLAWLRRHAGRSRPRVLLVSGRDDEPLFDAAILAGACGVVDHRADGEQFLKALDKVHEGELWLDHLATRRLWGKFARGGLDEAVGMDPLLPAALTEREREVLDAVVSRGGESVTRS